MEIFEHERFDLYKARERQLTISDRSVIHPVSRKEKASVALMRRGTKYFSLRPRVMKIIQVLGVNECIRVKNPVPHCRQVKR